MHNNVIDCLRHQRSFQMMEIQLKHTKRLKLGLTFGENYYEQVSGRRKCYHNGIKFIYDSNIDTPLVKELFQERSSQLDQLQFIFN